MFNIFTF
jgi:hypothetical protein